MIQNLIIWNSVFENIISGLQHFYICPANIFVFYIFMFEKITHFTIQFRSKNLTHFTNLGSLDIENNMLPQHSQKTFWITNFPANMFLFGVRKDICTAAFLGAQELHFWCTLKANVCIFLYISLKKLCSRDVVRSYLVGGGIGEAE